MPSEASPGKVAPLYRALREDADPLRRAAGIFAADVLEGLWRNDHRTISSVYATARTLVWCWAGSQIDAAYGRDAQAILTNHAPRRCERRSTGPTSDCAWPITSLGPTVPARPRSRTCQSPCLPSRGGHYHDRVLGPIGPP
ncbi:MAG: hypothetical protein ACYCTI_02610 [Acidimicrobiales bacterium]